MPDEDNSVCERVGPILFATPEALAVIASIRENYPQIRVTQRGSYWRIESRQDLHITKQGIEKYLGAAFVLPGDLEKIMPSFAGKFSVTEKDAEWKI